MPTITLENVTKNYKLDRRQQKEQKGKKYETGVEDTILPSNRGSLCSSSAAAARGKARCWI